MLTFKPDRPVKHSHHIERTLNPKRLQSFKWLAYSDPDSISVVTPLCVSPRIEFQSDSPQLHYRKVARQKFFESHQETGILKIRPWIDTRSHLP